MTRYYQLTLRALQKTAVALIDEKAVDLIKRLQSKRNYCYCNDCASLVV